MVVIDIQPLNEAMKSSDPALVRKVIAGVGSRVDDLELRQIPEIVEIMVSLFYIDLGDKPEFVHVVEDAVSIIASIGEPAVPTLIWLLRESDYKANLMIARTLGRIGPPAFGELKDIFYYPPTPWLRALAMFGLAKMSEAALMEILPDTVNALEDSDREVRDTAARTIGRIVDSFQPGQIPREMVREAFERLLVRLKDVSAVVRAKAVRSIGKMAKNQYLDDEQLAVALDSTRELLGLNDGDADPFYLVRLRAEETLGYLEKVI